MLSWQQSSISVCMLEPSESDLSMRAVKPAVPVIQLPLKKEGERPVWTKLLVMKLVMRGLCCCKQTNAHPYHVQHVSGLVVGRLPKQLIPAMTQSLPVSEELVGSVGWTRCSYD